MKQAIFVSMFMMLTGCITYNVYQDGSPIEKYADRNDLPQTPEEVQAMRVWGSSRLRPIGVRRIPESARREAKCNQGFIKFCDEDMYE